MQNPGLLRIVHVRVFVPRELWDESMRFYGETLGLAPGVRDAAGGYAAFEFPGGPAMGVELDRPESGEAPAAGRFLAVSILVDDADRVHGELAARGVRFVGPPETMAWGGRLAHFADPAGNIWTLAQYPEAPRAR